MTLNSRLLTLARVRKVTSTLALTVLSGCGPSYDDCQSHRTCAPTAPRGDGGSSDGPGASAGAGGDSVGAPTACSEEGAARCEAPAAPSVVRCQSGSWTRHDCAPGERCDSRAPACVPVADGCVERQPGEGFCEGQLRSVCGPDLVTRDDERCSGVCAEGECLPAECGDGVVQAGEACDDGNGDDTDACVRCELARCGDGFAWAGIEACDDGNERDDDACVGNCELARCGDGFLDPAEEECDFGSRNSDSGSCLLSCREAVCGDGVVWKDEEECDDANAVATDGCRSCAFAPTKLAAGAGFSCAVFGDGSLRCWGSNSVGQLGLGDTDNRGDGPGELGTALPVLALKGPVEDVALGVDHACAIAGGTVHCWGGGELAQLGQGNTAGRSVPGTVQVGSGRPAALALGQGFSCVLMDSGVVRCWGRGERGALGTGSAERVGDVASEMGAKLRPVAFSQLTDSNSTRVLRVAARRHRACAILDTAGVACWGDGLMLPEASAVRLSPAAELAVGGNHRCTLGVEGLVECWGQGGFGQLGYGDALDRARDDVVRAVPLPAGGDAESISAGDDFNCAVVRGGAYCWGKAGPWLGRPQHARDGDDLGDDPEEIASLSPIDLGEDAEVHALATGFAHVCALLTTADVKCWGANDGGELGLGDGEARGDDPGEMGDDLPIVSLR